LSDDSKIIDISPPILSRVFNELGNGIVNLNNARKITDFPVPFPLAQMITFMLMFHAIITPIICAALVQTPHTAGVITFVVICSFWSVNYIAVELEMPFGEDLNDLPLHHMQRCMNRSLAALQNLEAQEVPEFTFCSDRHNRLSTRIIDFQADLVEYDPETVGSYDSVRDRLSVSSTENAFGPTTSMKSHGVKNGQRMSVVNNKPRVLSRTFSQISRSESQEVAGESEQPVADSVEVASSADSHDKEPSEAGFQGVDKADVRQVRAGEAQGETHNQTRGIATDDATDASVDSLARADESSVLNKMAVAAIRPPEDGVGCAARASSANAHASHDLLECRRSEVELQLIDEHRTPPPNGFIDTDPSIRNGGASPIKNAFVARMQASAAQEAAQQYGKPISLETGPAIRASPRSTSIVSSQDASDDALLDFGTGLKGEASSSTGLSPLLGRRGEAGTGQAGGLEGSGASQEASSLSDFVIGPEHEERKPSTIGLDDIDFVTMPSLTSAQAETQAVH
jgi:hypothetical protein